MTVDLQNPTLIKQLLAEAARMGAEQAINDITCYTKSQACQMMNISYSTLQRRIAEKRIRTVDGKITGMEIRRYLTEQISYA